MCELCAVNVRERLCFSSVAVSCWIAADSVRVTVEIELVRVGEVLALRDAARVQDVVLECVLRVFVICSDRVGAECD